MTARALDIEYTHLDPASAWPLRPWGQTGTVAADDAETGPAAVPAVDDTPVVRKSRDRGASAVEWVIITAIVVAIVTGVGMLIANAVKSKATNACQQIEKTNTDTGGTTGGCGTAP